ncbi:FadR/GntR family transcriptional regulator [Rhizobium alvei]|uniref:Pyruvate dehydrogenase complex repressor n=1 Tax=Rhizobium alvei TaxID=1132659 RepID=A0ABT8YFF7_9HYPH|nr:FadR/GntR family transcriptional regulator [Rhizobium alvei]MDO6962421.1 FadR/GntR family transcriptional regulator [Rhizobium alvei]
MSGPFTQIDHGRTADEAVRQIEMLLLEGVLVSGDQLPSERDLAEQLDISRPVLREALKVLEERQLIVAHHGGGTYVADLVGQIFSPQLTELIARHDMATRDYLEFRRMLEGEAAELAALRATNADHVRLETILERMASARASGDFVAEAESDIELHNAIGEAAHNIILMHTLRSCYRLLSLGIFNHRKLLFDQPDARERLFHQHHAIVAAIRSGDGPAARKAAEDHIDYVAQTAAETALARERERLALLRAAQSNIRNNSRTVTSRKGPRP